MCSQRLSVLLPLDCHLAHCAPLFCLQPQAQLFEPPQMQHHWGSSWLCVEHQLRCLTPVALLGRLSVHAHTGDQAIPWLLSLSRCTDCLRAALRIGCPQAGGLMPPVLCLLHLPQFSPPPLLTALLQQLAPPKTALPAQLPRLLSLQTFCKFRWKHELGACRSTL